MAKYVTDKAFWCVSLRDACLGISIFFLAAEVWGVIAHPSYLQNTSLLVRFIIDLLANLALLFGVLWSNAWLVLAWFVFAVLFFIHWPIAVLGVIFNYGDYRAAAFFDNVFLILFEYILTLVILVYFSYIVSSYFHQLRNSQSATPNGSAAPDGSAAPNGSAIHYIVV